MTAEHLETNVPGLFIAGELGGMGLIHRAIEKGCLAIDNIRKLDGIGRGEMLDVVIVGAGPAGFAASLAAMQHNLRFVTLEQEDSLGGAVYMYPKGKIVMTRPGNLPMYGKTSFTETTKEKLLEFWNGVKSKTGVPINYREAVETITPNGNSFEVKSSHSLYKSRAVLLAIGRRGTPRKLNVCGEDDCKVVYRLIDPEEHKGKSVLVVGGGDSALEAATSIADQPNTRVYLSYRSAAFGRAKEKNRKRVAEAEAAGRLTLLLKSQVKEIQPSKVLIEHKGKIIDIDNDAVIVCAGGILPTGFLKEIGIHVETKYGTP